MHVSCRDCPEFRDEIPFKGGGGGGEYKTRENSNFRKNGKMIISVKTRNFSRSWMMKWTSPLELSYEI